MINVNKLPRPNYYGINVFNPTIVSHTFSLSSDDMLIYYEEIFRNRTNKNKPYIDRFNSIEELEEDIYMGNVIIIGLVMILKKYTIA